MRDEEFRFLIRQVRRDPNPGVFMSEPDQRSFKEQIEDVGLAPTPPDLPDDVVGFLQAVRKASGDEDVMATYAWRWQDAATSLLESHGVPTKTVEEELRTELAATRAQLARAGRQVDEANRRVREIAEDNQRRGRIINRANAEIAKLKAEQHLKALVPQESIERAWAILKAAGIEAEVSAADE